MRQLLRKLAKVPPLAGQATGVAIGVAVLYQLSTMGERGIHLFFVPLLLLGGTALAGVGVWDLVTSRRT